MPDPRTKRAPAAPKAKDAPTVHEFETNAIGCLIQVREVLMHHGYSVESRLVVMIDKTLQGRQE